MRHQLDLIYFFRIKFTTICLSALSIIAASAIEASLSSSFEKKDANTNCEQACTAISSTLPGSVFLAQSGDFNFWDDKQAEIVPACRVEPSSAEEVSSILSIVVDHGCHFAVKSGGHERSPGASNAEGGVTIDLVRLNSIRVADDRQSVIIGAGLRWGDVYQALEQDQLMVLGGRVANVGVGGLLLGGGISFFSNERGLACDSIISYELVLPNATIITVDERSQPILYRALRGAGHMNFGIVTSFTLEAFPATHQMWSGGKKVIGQDVEALLEANYELVTEGMKVDPFVAVMANLACVSRDGTCIASIAAEHTRHNSTAGWPASLQHYVDLDVHLDISSSQMSTITNTTQVFAEATQAGRHRTIYGTMSYEPSVGLELRIAEMLCQEMPTDEEIPGFGHGLTMHPFSRTMIANTRKHGGNAFQSLADHGGPLIILNVVWSWRDTADDERAYESYYRFMSRIEDAAQEIGLWHPYKYINYAEASQDIWTGYGDTGDLKKLRREIDPNGIFARGGLAGGVHKLNDVSPPRDSNAASEATILPYKSEL